jgi:hypothetical protein
MKTKSLSFKISPAIGSVSAECFVHRKANVIMTLAHGAGAGNASFFHGSHCHNPFLKQALLHCVSISILPKIKREDPILPLLLIKQLKRNFKSSEIFPKLPLFVAGKSFGGRMTSQCLAAHPNDNVKGIIFYGFPFTCAGQTIH